MYEADKAAWTYQVKPLVQNPDYLGPNPDNLGPFFLSPQSYT